MSDKLTNDEVAEEANAATEVAETEAEVAADDALVTAAASEVTAEEAQEIAEVLVAESADEDTIVEAISIAIEAEAPEGAEAGEPIVATIIVEEGAELPIAGIADVGAPAADGVVAETTDAAPAADAPAAPSSPEAVRGPSGYVESEGGRPSRIGSGVKASDVDYKNIALLSRFLDRRGRILSRRKTRVSAKVQRRVAQAIKRARHLALLPYTSDQTRVVRKRR
jgi:ribosomal protein S18